MRLGPAIHGALLALALVFAYKTWTREPEPEVKGGEVVVWSESAEAFESLVFEGKNKKVTIERRADNAGTYLWGMAEKSQTKVAKPRGPHGIPGHGAPTPMTPTAPTTPTTPTTPTDEAAPGAAPPAGKSPDPKGPAKPDAAKPDAAKRDAAKPDAAKPDAAKPAKPDAKKAVVPAQKAPAAKPTPREPPERAPKEAAKPPADGAKADQNDPIPQDPAKPKAPPAPATPKADPKATPAKPDPTAPAKPGATPTGAPTEPPDHHDADAADAAGAPAAAPALAPGDKEVTVRQFPVGKNGTALIESLANLRALRSLGVPTDDQKIEYGLDETEETLTIKFKGGVQHTLLVGDRAYGGSDRYVLEPKSGKGYVLSSDLMKNFDSSENSLGLQTYNDFDLKEDLHQITVDVNGATQTLVRLEVEDDAKPDAKRPPKIRTTWARKEEPTSEDVTMANFVDRASKLRPVEYLPDLDPKSLTLIARFEYGDKTGKSVGYLDFYKGVDPSSTKPGADGLDYFMKTERTRVVGKVSKLTAERVDQDLAEVFGTSNTDDATDDGTEEGAPPLGEEPPASE